MYEKDFEKNSKKNKNSGNRSGMVNFIIMMLPRVLGLGFKLGLFYLGLKRKAKKAGKLFEKELLAAGINKKMAKQLKEEYMATSHILHQFKFSEMIKQ